MERLSLVAVLLIASVLGCAGDKEPPRGPAKGRVTVGGKPVSNATIVFENAELGVTQSAPLDGDGNYEFTSYKGKGLPVGSYKVAVVGGRFLQPGEEIPFVDVTKKPGPPPTPPSAVPEKYTKTGTSELTGEVKPNGGSLDFDLKP